MTVLDEPIKAHEGLDLPSRPASPSATTWGRLPLRCDLI